MRETAFEQLESAVERLEEKLADFERELNERSEDFRQFMDSVPDGIIVYRDDRIVFANKAALSLLEADSPEAVLGASPKDYFHTDDENNIVEWLKKIKCGEGLEYMEKRIVGLKGGVRTVEMVANHIKFDGKPAFQLLARNIIDKKLSEKSCTKNEEWYRGLLDNLPALVLVVRNGKCIYVNPSAAMLGYAKPEDILGIDVLQAIAPQYRESIRERIRNVAGDKSGKPTEMEIPKPNGGTIVCEAISIPIQFEGELADLIFGIDISERKKMEAALRASEKRYSDIVKNMPGALYQFVLEENGSYTMSFLSEGAEEILGISRELLTDSKSLISRLFLGEKEQLKQSIIESAKNLSEWKQEIRIRISRNKYKWIQCKSNPQKLSGGRTVWNGVMLDITEKKLSEEKLESSLKDASKSKDEVEALLRSARTILTRENFALAAERIFDECKNVIGAQSGYVALLSEDGAENEILFLDAGGMACTVDRNFPMPIRGLRAEVYSQARVLYENNFAETGWNKLLPDGHPVLKNVLFAPMIIDGKPIGLLGFANKEGGFTNEDARIAGAFGEFAAVALKKTRGTAALVDSEQRYKFLFDNMNSGVAVYEAIDGGRDFLFKSINKAGAAICRLSSSEIIGKRVTAIFPGIESMGLLSIFKSVYATGIPEDQAFTEYRDDNISFWADNRIFKLPSGEIVAIFKDVTAQKTAEEEMKNYEEQYYQAQRMESIGRLAGGIAHDFNNILVGIMGYAELLRMQFPDESSSEGEAAEVILRGAERAADLTRQLLGFARKGKFNPEPLDANRIIRDTVKVSEKIFDKRIDVVLDLKEHLSLIHADKHQLEQVLTNIIINAKDAMPKGGTLTVRTADLHLKNGDGRYDGQFEPGLFVEIAISDTGIGIPQELLMTIFEPFFTTKGEGKGTGLGLATAYGIIKNHKGHITVESKPGQGATFRIYIPASEADSMEFTEEIECIKGQGMILIVDDEDDVRLLACRMLEKLGYSVIAARNGLDALRIYGEKKHEIDIVLLDIIMPGLPGRETFIELQKVNPQIRVILSSGYSEDEQAAEMMNRGVAAFIQKPYKMHELSRSVDEVMKH